MWKRHYLQLSLQVITLRNQILLWQQILSFLLSLIPGWIWSSSGPVIQCPADFDAAIIALKGSNRVFNLSVFDCVFGMSTARDT